MKAMLNHLELYILLAFILCWFAGCQNYEKIEYYENGAIKSKETRSGIPPWSDGKVVNVNGVKAL